MKFNEQVTAISLDLAQQTWIFVARADTFGNLPTARADTLGYQGETDRYYDSIANWMMKLSGWQIDAKQNSIYNASIYSAA